MAKEVTIKKTDVNRYAQVERAMISAATALNGMGEDEMLHTIFGIKAWAAARFAKEVK